MMKGGRNPSELADEGPCKRVASGLSASVPFPYLERTAGPPGDAEEVAITGSSALLHPSVWTLTKLEPAGNSFELWRPRF
jgi:hypothetical protein